MYDVLVRNKISLLLLFTYKILLKCVHVASSLTMHDCNNLPAIVRCYLQRVLRAPVGECNMRLGIAPLHVKRFSMILVLLLAKNVLVYLLRTDICYGVRRFRANELILRPVKHVVYFELSV